MKKVIFKNVLVALVLTLGFMFSGAVESNAQSTDVGFFTPPTGNFVGVDVAKDRLVDEMTTLKDLLVNLSPPLSYPVVTKLNYYMGIYRSLEGGKDVPNAIVDGLVAIRSNLQQPVAVSGQEMIALKDDAANILK